MKILFLAALLTVAVTQEQSWPPFSGYDLGARDGSSFGQLDREVLPAAQDGANILDIWILPAIYLQYGSGGHSQLEPMRYTAYGRSWRSNNTYIDQVDVSDPFSEGQALISVPWGVWSSFKYSGLRHTYGDGLGVTYVLSQPRTPGFHGQVESSYIGETGGPTLIPPNTLDGEPGTSRGAPEARRHILGNNYYGASGRYCTKNGCYWVGADLQQIDRSYITHDFVDAGERLRVATGFEQYYREHTFTGRFLYEGQEHSAQGGEYRLAEADLAAQKSRAFHGQLGWDYKGWQLRAGYTYKSESLQPFGSVERVEISDWRASSFALPDYGDSQRGLLQTSLKYRYKHHTWNNIYLFDHIAYEPVYRTRLYSYLGQPQWLETFSNSQPLDYQRHRFRTFYKYQREFAKIDVQGLFGLFVQSSYVQGENAGFNWVSPYGQLDAIFKITPKFHITLAGLTDVPAVSYQALAFANSGVAHSSRRFILTDGTLGAEVRQGGGDTHSLDDSLQPPREWEMFLGFGGTNGKRFSWRFNVIERFYTGRLMVVYDDSQQRYFQATSLKDPWGETRGAYLSLSGSGQDLTAFIKDSALWGKDKYVLTNDSKMALYQGIEIQLMSAGKVGFFNLSGTAYWVEGFSPYGSGPTYNDFLAVDEESADPNWQINQKGRLDGCRALGLNITWGIRFFSHPRYGSLFFASATRYRDGEPFFRVVVAEDLPQGATPVMANWRAGVRYTYNMSCDLRLAYRLPLGISTLWIYADIYNLLDSTAEINEVAYTTDNYRQALESIPPRTFMLKIKITLGS